MKALKELCQVLIILGLALSLAACASNRLVMPTMDLPPEPKKPAIVSTVVMKDNVPYVAYTVGDSLKLYEYLISKDSYEEKLIFRINSMNQLLQGK